MTNFLKSHSFGIVTTVLFAVAAIFLVAHGHDSGHLLLLPAMAYPTTLAFKGSQPGLVGLAAFNLSDTTQRHPLGMRAKFIDPTYGEIEAIYLKGVASTAAGDLVVYDPKNATTTRTVAASRGPIAVALAANVALQFGWYAIQGVVPVSTTAAGTGAANALLQVTATPGQGTVSGTAGVKIDGAVCKSAQDAPGASFTDVELHFPAANGNT